VGMSAILGAVVCGCTAIIAVDVIPDRLEKAKEPPTPQKLRTQRS